MVHSMWLWSDIQTSSCCICCNCSCL